MNIRIGARTLSPGRDRWVAVDGLGRGPTRSHDRLTADGRDRWVADGRAAHLANRHDRARWFRTLAPLAAIAHDRMLLGDRTSAIKILCEVMPVWLACDLTRPVAEVRAEMSARRIAEASVNVKSYRQAAKPANFGSPGGVARIAALSGSTAAEINAWPRTFEYAAEDVKFTLDLKKALDDKLVTK